MKRRSHWESFFQTRNAVSTTSDSVTTMWAKWPSASIDDSDLTYNLSYVTEQDETIVRSICQVDAFVPSVSGSQIIQLAWGLIAFESVQPIDFDLAVFDNTTSLQASSPIDGGLDWLWRAVRIFDVRTGIFASNPVLNDVECTSRAMRKLPAGTGILACMACETADDSPVANMFWAMHGRILIKNAV